MTSNHISRLAVALVAAMAATILLAGVAFAATDRLVVMAVDVATGDAALGFVIVFLVAVVVSADRMVGEQR